jgi:hypothetical protein
MAEVRPIPSAVGAFEAQVIDFNKTYNAIVQNAAAIRKRQAQAQKDIEKQMDVALADKRAIRPQDSDYVEEKRQEVYNYYFQNRDNIMAGGKAAGELKMKMGEFTSAVNQSSSLNRRGMSLNPAWKEAMKDENQMDDGLTEVQRVWSLPINDPKRKNATFDRGGYQASIDEFDVPDISYYKKFNEIKDIYDPITKNVKPYTVETMRLTTNPKIGKYVDQTTKLQLYNPTEIVNTVTAAVSGSKSRGFLSDYGKQLAVYKSMPQGDRDLELKSVIEAYKDLEGTDMTSWFAKQGGTAGIDNELELAAFKQLQNNLPQLVKDTYDYRTQNVMFRQWEQGFRAAKFDWEKMQVKTLDEQIVDDINSGKYVPEVWDSRLNAMYNVGNPVTGGTRAGEVKSSVDKQGNVTVNYTIQKPIYGPDGTLLTTSNAILSNVKNQYVNPTTGTDVAVAPNGVYYTKQTRTDVIRKKDPAGIFKMTTLNDRLREGINNEDVGKSIDAYRFKTSGLKGQPGVTTPKSKGSGQSIKMNKTTNR